MKDFIHTTIRYIIASIITTTNLNKEATEEEREAIINNSFNGLMNALSPEYAIMALDIILGYSDTYKKLENEKMFDQLGWNRKDNINN